MYAPIRAVRYSKNRWLVLGLSLISWGGILLAAYRGGGDQWDNPRYRLMFIVLQSSLAGWVWNEQRQESDSWLRRILVGVGLCFTWLIPWYVRRYYPQITWAVVDLFKTIGLGLASAVLYWIWDWAGSEN
jgi:hypothetical protein